jgi:hypothetical protein
LQLARKNVIFTPLFMTTEEKIIRKLETIAELAEEGNEITVENVRTVMKEISNAFRLHLELHQFSKDQIRKLRTKLRDAGRRSPPWKPHSSRVAGRPQDGSDGNRINRWLMEEDHKFYATEIVANLVEIKYYLQCFSMVGCPPLPNDSIKTCFAFIMEHDVTPGEYKDPIQKSDISLIDVLADARIIQSGHIHPLDRNGRHEPSNTFLMLKRSNQLQGNLTVSELLDLMESILHKHNRI